MAEQSGLLVVGIHKDRFSCDTTHLIIITTRKTRFYDLASAFYRSYLTVIEHEKIKQSESYESAVIERSAVRQ